jgi:hypothetical protein
MMNGAGMATEKSFASGSVTAHVVRGVVGFGLLAASVVLVPLVGPFSLFGLPAGVVALRGCPTCWVIGLAQTISRGRLERRCLDGRCQLSSAAPDASTTTNWAREAPNNEFQAALIPERQS